MSTVKTKPVFFGIEKSDYSDDCDILEISMKCGPVMFNKYIDPSKPIDKKLTEINHLTVVDGKLYLDGLAVQSEPLHVVMEQLLRYLQQFNKPCNLVGFRFTYADGHRLIRLMKKVSLEKEFSTVIAGFTDTLNMFKEKFPNNGPEKLNILSLAKDTNNMKWPDTKGKNGRSAKRNVFLLENLTFHHFPFKSVWVPKKSFIEISEPKSTTATKRPKSSNNDGGTKAKNDGQKKAKKDVEKKAKNDDEKKSKNDDQKKAKDEDKKKAKYDSGRIPKWEKSARAVTDTL